MRYEEMYTSSFKTHVRFDIYTPPVVLREKAVICLFHDIREDLDAYQHFASWLSERGFIVVVNEMVGHGKSLIDYEQGYFGSSDVYEHFMHDMNHLQNILLDRYPNTPYYFLGQGIGANLVTLYSQIFGDYLEGILLLSPVSHLLFDAFERLHLYHNKTFKGPMYRSYKFRQEKNKKLSSYVGGKDYDYRTHDKNIKKIYTDDPFVNFVYTTQSLMDMDDIVSRSIQKTIVEDIPKHLSISLYFGLEDPISLKNEYYPSFLQHFNDIQCMSYQHSRHSLLFDDEKMSVYQDIFNWLNDRTHL